MTCVEFLDKATFENIYSCLYSVPDRVVFVDSDSDRLRRETEKYRDFFERRGDSIEFVERLVPHNDIEGAVDVICDIVNSYEDLVFDIFGGNELLFVALGIAYERNRDKNIRINRHNFKNGVDSIKRDPNLTVEEYVGINGGRVVYGDITDNKTCRWDMSEDFESDIDRMYYLCKNRSKLWNSMTSLLSAFDKAGEKRDSGLSVLVSKKIFESLSSEKKADFIKVQKLLLYLERLGIFKKLEFNKSAVVEITYKNHQIKKCLMKAGQILEMKIYKTVKSLSKDGRAVCSDVKTGVVIDWCEKCFEDGETQSSRNEIDVFAMSGLIPIFISCKNGAVDTEELYKLNTVAAEFGGEKAKKILVATSLSQGSEKLKYFRQRMKDMDIYLIENLKNHNDESLSQMLRSVILSEH